MTRFHRFPGDNGSHPISSKKRPISFLVLHFLQAAVLLITSFLMPQTIQAQTSGNQDTYTFAEFGYQEAVLNGPFDQATYAFGIPGSWDFQEGTSLQLNLAVYIETPQTTNREDGEEHFGGFLQVRFNRQVFESVLIDGSGDLSLEFSIPETAYQPTYSQNRHHLEITLTNDAYCSRDLHTTVVIKPSSRLVLPHIEQEISPGIDQLPWPFFQENALTEQRAILVMPDDPTPQELQAVLTVSAGLGRMTGDDFELSMVKESALKNIQKSSTGLIFVGQYEHLNLVSEVDWPSSMLVLNNNYPEDGILQVAASPWNSALPVLLITGKTHGGLLKAARAFGLGEIIGNLEPNLGVIQGINPSRMNSSPVTDRTLADLGYPSEVVDRFGTVRRNFDFYLPAGWTAAEDAYFELVYSHSELIDFTRSGLMIALNGQPIASREFGQQTSSGATLPAAIPSELLKPGRNQLQVQAELQPTDPCAFFSHVQTWFSILSSSLLHLPLQEILPGEQYRVLGIAYYPGFLYSSPQPGKIAFLLADLTPPILEATLQLAYDLGAHTDLPLTEISILDINQISSEAAAAYDLIAVGFPEELSFLSDPKVSLPVMFEPESNFPRETNLPVSYLISTNADQGMIMVAESPWNPERTLTAVLGTSPSGLLSASTWMSNPDLRRKLEGNFAITQGEQAFSAQAEYGPDQPEPVQFSPEEPAQTTAPREVPAPVPDWAVPALITVGIAALAVFSYGLNSMLRKKRYGGDLQP